MAYLFYKEIMKKMSYVCVYVYIFVYHVCICVFMMYVGLYMCHGVCHGGQRITLRNWFFPSPFA